MKQGDLVEIIERAMGMRVPSGIVGIIIRNSEPSNLASLDMWEVLIMGVVKSVSRREIM